MLITSLYELVGVRYNSTGFSPQEGFSCYGLIWYGMKLLKNYELPLNKSTDATKIMQFVSEYIAKYKVQIISSWRELSFGDILILSIDDEYHFGIKLKEFDVIHSREPIGVVLDKFYKPMQEKFVYGVRL
jgi:hypothetical protein